MLVVEKEEIVMEIYASRQLDQFMVMLVKWTNWIESAFSCSSNFNANILFLVLIKLKTNIYKNLCGFVLGLHQELK